MSPVRGEEVTPKGHGLPYFPMAKSNQFDVGDDLDDGGAFVGERFTECLLQLFGLGDANAFTAA